MKRMDDAAARRWNNVEWRCSLCPASGYGADENSAFWRYESHYLKVHHEKPGAT